MHSIPRSLNATTVPTGNPIIPRCIPTKADPTSTDRMPRGRVAWGVQTNGPNVDTQRVERRSNSQGMAVCAQDTSFRSYAEMLYSGTLTTQQVDDIYMHGSQFPGGSR